MRRSKRSAAALSALSVAALAAATVGLSGATFATRTADLRVTVDAGTLDLQSTRDGQGVVADASGLRPGEERSGQVTVSHVGAVEARAVFDVLPDLVDQPGSPRLSDVLRLELERCDSDAPGCPGAQAIGPAGTTLAQAAAADWVELGPSQSGDQRTYRVTLSWPEDADDPDLQGSSTQATLAFGLWAGQ